MLGLTCDSHGPLCCHACPGHALPAPLQPGLAYFDASSEVCPSCILEDSSGTVSHLRSPLPYSNLTLSFNGSCAFSNKGQPTAALAFDGSSCYATVPGLPSVAAADPFSLAVIYRVPSQPAAPAATSEAPALLTFGLPGDSYVAQLRIPHKGGLVQMSFSGIPPVSLEGYRLVNSAPPADAWMLDVWVREAGGSYGACHGAR